MLGARLFGLAAVLVAVTAMLPVKLATAGIDFVMHDTYFVIPPRYSYFGFALLCGLIAGFYYLADRASGNRLNKRLTIAHFLLWTFAVAISFAVEFTLVRAVVSGRDPNQSWLLPLGSLGAFPAFLIGGVLFLINFGWAMARKLRAS